MLCIKKNKCFSTVLLLSQKKQTAYCNPFRPVETRSDLLKPVETRFNPFRSVETRFKVSPPFRGVLVVVASPPPPQDFKQQQQKTKFSHSFFSLLCNLPLLPPRGFSLSPLMLLLLLKTT